MINIKCHLTLAAYFLTKPYYLDEPIQSKPHIRKLIELPYQQLKIAMLTEDKNLKSGYWDAAVDLLSDLHFLVAKTGANTSSRNHHTTVGKNLTSHWSIPPMLADLLNDFYCTYTSIPYEHPKFELMERLNEFIIRHLIQIVRSPYSLVSQISIDFRTQSRMMSQLNQPEFTRKIETNIMCLNPDPASRSTLSVIDLPFLNNIAVIESLPDSDDVLVGSQSGDIFRIDVRRRIIINSTHISAGRLYSIATGSDATMYCLLSDSPSLFLFDVNSIVTKGSIPLNISEPRWVSFSHATKMIIVGGYDSLEFIEPNSNRRTRIPYPPRETIQVPYRTNMIEFSPSGASMAIACQSGEILIFDLIQQVILAKRGYCGQGALSLAFESEKVLWAGSWDGNLIRWNLESGDMQFMELEGDAVESMLWLSKELILVSGHHSGYIRLWNTSQTRPISSIKLSTDWIRVLSNPKNSNVLFVGTKKLFYLPSQVDKLRELNFDEINPIASEVYLHDKGAIITDDESILYFSFNKGLSETIPVGGIVAEMIKAGPINKSPDFANVSDRLHPWEKRQHIHITAICIAQDVSIVFVACSEGSVLGLDFKSKQIVFVSFASDAPVTRICCNRSGTHLAFTSGHTIFGYTMNSDAQLKPSARVRFHHELKPFPAMLFIGDDTIVCDTGKATEVNENSVSEYENSDLEIRMFPDLEKISKIQIPINIAFLEYDSQNPSIIAVEGDIRFLANSYSNLTGENDFKPGRLYPIETCRYSIWRIPLKGFEANFSFTDKSEELFSGHFSSPIGICICDDQSLIAILSRDGNLSLWNYPERKRIQEVQLKSNGLIGPVFIGSNEFLCFDNGQGSKTGPEMYHFKIQ